MLAAGAIPTVSGFEQATLPQRREKAVQLADSAHGCCIFDMLVDHVHNGIADIAMTNLASEVVMAACTSKLAHVPEKQQHVLDSIARLAVAATDVHGAAWLKPLQAMILQLCLANSFVHFQYPNAAAMAARMLLSAALQRAAHVHSMQGSRCMQRMLVSMAPKARAAEGAKMWLPHVTGVLPDQVRYPMHRPTSSANPGVSMAPLACAAEGADTWLPYVTGVMPYQVGYPGYMMPTATASTTRN